MKTKSWGKKENIEFVILMITNGDEIEAELYCQDNKIPHSLFIELLKWLNPKSKLLQ